MTYEEAIEAIKCNMPLGGYETLTEALHMAIEAFELMDKYGGVEAVKEACEKQNPKKPIFGEDDWYECEECGYSLFYGQEHCSRCGQRQDWSEEE